MKKIPILFLSILFTGLVFTPTKPTSAAIKDQGTTWWSVEEMLEFYKEFDRGKSLPYITMQAVNEDVVITIYDKNKK